MDVHSWMSVPQVSMAQAGDHMKDTMPLDSCSSVDPFHNPNFVCNKIKIKKTLSLACNAGVLKTDHQAEVSGCGNVWFDKSAIANVFSLAKLVKKCRVQFDSAVENTFILHGPKGVIKFSCTLDNLCAFIPKCKTGTEFDLVNMVEENKLFHTNQEVFWVKQAKKLPSVLAFPALSELKAIVWMNQIRGNPIETGDLDLIKKFCGPDAAYIECRTTRKRPPTAGLDTVNVPLELCMAQHNAMFVNRVAFLTSVSCQKSTELASGSHWRSPSPTLTSSPSYC